MHQSTSDCDYRDFLPTIETVENLLATPSDSMYCPYLAHSIVLFDSIDQFNIGFNQTHHISPLMLNVFSMSVYFIYMPIIQQRTFGIFQPTPAKPRITAVTKHLTALPHSSGTK